MRLFIRDVSVLLPDNLLLLMSEASLAKAPSVLLENCTAVDKGGVFKPRIVFALLFILTVVLTVAECVWRKWFKYYDVALSVCLAILSVIFWYLWVISLLFLVSLARGLSLLFTFSKNQL